jgi:hypothetical protein
MTSHDDQVRLPVRRSAPGQSLATRLEVAEAELDDLDEQTKGAFRAYKALDLKMTAKTAEVRELRLMIREAQAPGTPPA